MMWPPHPDDEWIDVTPMGAYEPQYVLGRSGWDPIIGLARSQYVVGQIEAEDFIAVVESVR